MADDTTTKTPTVTWDDSQMRSTYANVCNVSSTREEGAGPFWTNRAWQGSASEVTVELSDRIIMSPFAAKRLSMLLANVIGQYESRFGTLDVVPNQAPGGRAN